MFKKVVVKSVVTVPSERLWRRKQPYYGRIRRRSRISELQWCLRFSGLCVAVRGDVDPRLCEYLVRLGSGDSTTLKGNRNVRCVTSAQGACASGR